VLNGTATNRNDQDVQVEQLECAERGYKHSGKKFQAARSFGSTSNHRDIKVAHREVARS